MKFALLKDTDGKYYSFDEYKTAIEPLQTDKDKKLVYLYTTDPQSQYTFIEAAKSKGYNVLLMDCELDAHFVNLLEQKFTDSRFSRVDSDAIDNLIPKEDRKKPEVSESEKSDLQDLFKAVLPKDSEFMIEPDNLGSEAAPIIITQNEFMRRYRDMSAMGGGLNFYGNLPAAYNLIVNLENPVISKIVDEERKAVGPQKEVPEADPAIIQAGEAKDATDEQKKAAEDARAAAREAKESAHSERKAEIEEFASKNDILKQICDLALLSNGLLKGKDLSDFIARSQKVVNDAYLK